jgi:hypothetical protein
VLFSFVRGDRHLPIVNLIRFPPDHPTELPERFHHGQ